jgi:multidrug efflux pump subunit AcrB
MNFMSTMAMGLVAGVLVDDAIVEIENIVRHMRMGKSAYQASLDAADEIGLAVLATTMAIVAVFFPVALMPGIAGQYFKAFGFTVVVSVLMSLFVARMITPLIAAYFLRSKGVQPHAAWKWMDAYLKVLNWSLDTTKAHALLERLPKPARKFGNYALVLLLLVPVLIAFVAALGGTMKLLGMVHLPGAISFGLAFLVGCAAAYYGGKGVSWLVQALWGHSRFGEWHALFVGRWNARMHDHRLAMVAAGVVTLLASVALFGTLSQSFFPPQNDDYSRVNITLPPGSTLKQTEAAVDRVAALVRRIRASSVSSSESMSAPAGQHRPQEGPRSHQHRVRAQAVSDARGFPGRASQLHEPEWRRPDADQRDIMLYLGGDDPVQLTAVANKIAKEMERRSGLRAPRVGSQLAQPEITIKPRFDLAADLGVTTAALSQTIRIATLGDIEQNSAKFSLSDRQVPIQVRCRRTPAATSARWRTFRCRRRAAARSR